MAINIRIAQYGHYSGMSILDMLFGNRLMLYGIVGTTATITLFIALWLFFRPITQVLLFGESDRTIQPVEVHLETPKALKHNSRKNPKRFFKWGGSYLQVSHGKRISNYIGKRGTAYTWRIAEQGNPEPAPVKVGSVFDAISVLWDKSLVEKIPQADADKLKSGEFYVTVQLEQGLTPGGFTPITEEDLASEGDKDMAKLFAEGAKAGLRQPMLPILLAVGSGFAISTLVFGLLGWLRIG